MSVTNPSSTTKSSPQQQQQHIYQNLRPPTASNPNRSQGIMYPVASSGRGFIPKPLRPNNNSNSNSSGDQTVTVANHGGGYPPRPNQLPPYHPRPHLDASLSNYHHHLVQQYQHHIIRPPLNQHPQISPPIRGIPVPVPSGHLKVTPSPSSISDSNGYKHFRDKKDETIAIVRDRKVRISEGASLYALCRSWLRNRIPEESQPQYGDWVKALPRPLPMPMADTNVVKEKEDDEEKDFDQLSAEDLLRRHVKRAKHIRTRLRDERAKRIERYKTRLSLLLPPLVEQPRNDAPAGN